MLRRWHRETRVPEPKASKTPKTLDEVEALKAHIQELEAAREPLTLARAREQYIALLEKADPGALGAEVSVLLEIVIEDSQRRFELREVPIEDAKRKWEADEAAKQDPRIKKVKVEYNVRKPIVEKKHVTFHRTRS